jgi:hypothetical protein
MSCSRENGTEAAGSAMGGCPGKRPFDDTEFRALLKGCCLTKARLKNSSWKSKSRELVSIGRRWGAYDGSGRIFALTGESIERLGATTSRRREPIELRRPLLPIDRTAHRNPGVLGRAIGCKDHARR